MPARRKIRPQDLELPSPDPRRHAEAVYDLTGKCFPAHGYFNWIRRCRASYFGHSHYDWNASTIGLLDAQVLTHWGVWGYRMRIGRARVRVAGIGAVATHGDHRRQGLMARTAAAGLERIRRQGYDLSLLFGISHFYDRFGYVRAWATGGWSVPVGELPRDRPAARLEKFRVCYREDIDQLYDRQNEGLTGTAVRPTYVSNKPGRGQVGYLLRGGRQKVAGYVIGTCPPGRFLCQEFAGDTEQVLRVLGRLARARHCTGVDFDNLHYNSDLCRHLRRSTCTCTRHYTARGGAMVRTVNLPAALRKMAAELARRIRRSHVASWQGRLLIADGREAAVLRIARSGIRVEPPRACRHAIRGGDEIAQLLIGTHEPMETVGTAGIRLRGDAPQLVKVLFPWEHPMIGARDRF